jgi:hypothetical protein
LQIYAWPYYLFNIYYLCVNLNNSETSISLDQVSPRLPMELKEMPAAFKAQGGFFSQSKNPEQAKREL